MRMAMAGWMAAGVLAAAGTAQAGIVADFVQTGSVQIGGTDYNVWELRVTTDDDWLLTTLRVDLTAGTMYQNAFNDNAEGTGPPGSTVIQFVPDAAFDTYATVPGGGNPFFPTDDPNFPDYVTTMTESVFQATWFDTGDAGAGTFGIAQITLSADAAGSVSGLVAGGGDTFDYFDGTHGSTQRFAIGNGSFVPEPGTLALLGLGGVVIAGGRRRRARGG